MPHCRFLYAVLVIALITSFSESVTPLQAATPRAQKIIEARAARLAKRLKRLHGAASSSSSSSSSGSLRSHRRGGGGGSQSHAGTSSSAITLVAPTITFADVTKNYGDGIFTLQPTSNSEAPFTFTIANASVATISGNNVTLGNAGTTTITAVQAQNGNYFQSKTVTATLTVNTIAPTIIPLIQIIKNSSDPPFLLPDPTSNSAGAFTFTSTNLSVATIVGRTVTIRGSGTATIISTQAANGNYKSGSGTTTLVVNPGLEEA